MSCMLAADERFNQWKTILVKQRRYRNPDKKYQAGPGFELMTLDAILCQMRYHTKRSVIQASNGKSCSGKKGDPSSNPW